MSTEHRRPRVLVVFVISGLQVGGAEAVLLKLLPRLSSTIRPHVISLTTIGPIGEKIADAGITVESVEMAKGLRGLVGFARLVRRLRALQPDIVQTVMYHADLIGGIASRLAGVRRLIWWIHNSGASLHALNPITRLIIKLCARLSHKLPNWILCCAEVARRNHIAFGYDASKMEVLPNGFDLEEFQPDPSAAASVRHELSIPESSMVVGLVARLDPQKDHQRFFETASCLHRRLPNVHFLLAGQGLDETSPVVSQWVETAGIGSVTHLLGRRDDVKRLMAALTILASSSIAEAFPNVIGEAMACEVPCAVTDAGDSAYIVGDTGRIFNPGDAAAACQAWFELLSLPPDERLALGRAARQRVAELFSLPKIVDRQEALYCSLAEQRIDSA